MTPTHWLALARERRDALHSLIRRYHPQMRTVNTPDLPISAPGAEAACKVVRRQIQRRTNGMLWPTVRFDAALDSGDHSEVATILNETWMGVPESTECWSLTGFRKAVDLLEEQPEYDGPEDET